ncbi:MAG TPA: NUDIX domain-containing protein, partial [Acidiphilium sp.]
GATLCTPRNPSCMICPWREACAAHRLGIAADLPRKEKKAARPVRFGTVFLLRDPAGQIGLRRRPPGGLLGAMFELPGTGWESAAPDAEPPVAASWRDAGAIRHVFTHFELSLRVMAAPVAALPDGLIPSPADAPLPTVMRKAVAAGLAALD